MKRRIMMVLLRTLRGAALFSIAFGAAAFAEDKITFTNLDAIVRSKPLPPGPTADIMGSRHVDASRLQVVVARKIDLHTHEDTDHIVYMARGGGTFRFAGKARPVKMATS